MSWWVQAVNGQGAARGVLALALCSLASLGLLGDALAAREQPAAPDEGIRFACDPARLSRVEADMAIYLASLGISSERVVTKRDPAKGALVYTLNTPREDTDTIRLGKRPEFAIRDGVVRLPGRKGKTRKVATVSRKEIVLALLQHGRLTEFSGGNCAVAVLKEVVEVRQNIVAWTENLNWVWPNGGAARWNPRYWREGTPLPGVSLHAAFNDAFLSQGKYAIGCYTATKIAMAHGVLDYYRRIGSDRSRGDWVEARLNFDGDPLVDVEPGKTWSFLESFDPNELHRPGKVLQVQFGVAARNFVPGDWAYMVNTDPVSSEYTGYEASSTIYLGRGKFADYYNDNGHFYTYHQKLDEVYQWRNGVFSRSRDAAKIKPLPPDRLDQLGRTPAEGGLVMDLRISPYFFAGGEVPEPR